MIYSRGEPAHYAGSYDVRRRYDGGAIVYHDGEWFCSKLDDNSTTPSPVNANWAALGSMGAVPTQVSHRWHPRPLQYPCDDSNNTMSEVVWVCDDCWKDADLKNAFDARSHLFVIQENERALGL